MDVLAVLVLCIIMVYFSWDGYIDKRHDIEVTCNCGGKFAGPFSAYLMWRSQHYECTKETK